MSEQIGNFVPPEHPIQPTQSEGTHSASVKTGQMGKRPFLTKLKERFATWHLKTPKHSESAPEPKPIQLEHVPELSRLNVLNRLTDLPVPHQMRALRLVYEEAKVEEELGPWDQGDMPSIEENNRKPLSELRQQMLDNFAISLEPDSEKRETALRLQQVNAHALKEERDRAMDKQIQEEIREKQMRIQNPEQYTENRRKESLVGHVYRRLDPSIFSSDVAQSRAVMQEVLQPLFEMSKNSGGRPLWRTLTRYDHTKHDFAWRYQPQRRIGI